MVCDIVHSMFEDFMESVYCIMVKVFDDNKIKPRLRKQIDYYLTYDAQKCPSSDDARIAKHIDAALNYENTQLAAWASLPHKLSAA